MNTAPGGLQYFVHTLERQGKCVCKIKLKTFSFLRLITGKFSITDKLLYKFLFRNNSLTADTSDYLDTSHLIIFRGSTLLLRRREFWNRSILSRHQGIMVVPECCFSLKNVLGISEHQGVFLCGKIFFLFLILLYHHPKDMTSCHFTFCLRNFMHS